MLYKTPDVGEPTEWNNVFAIIKRRELFVRIFKNSWDTFKSLSCGLCVCEEHSKRPYRFDI